MEWACLGDPNHTLSPEAAGITLGTSHLSEDGPKAPTSRETIWSNKPLDYSREPLSDLKFLSFKKQHKGDPGYSTTTLSLTTRAHLCLQAEDLSTVIFRKNVTCDHNSLANIWTIYLKYILASFVSKRWSPGIQMVRGEAWSQSNRGKGSWGEALFIHPGLRWHLKLAGRNYRRGEEE